MDSKKSLQQHKLKGATRILSRHSSNADDQPNKILSSSEINHHQPIVESTTTSSINTALFYNTADHLSQHNQHNLMATNNILQVSTSDGGGAATQALAVPSSSSSSFSGLQTSPSSSESNSNATATTTTTTTLNTEPSQPTMSSTTQLTPCDIKALFECPICFDYAVPPIYQCQNGHLVCQSCSTKITSCPTCRVPIKHPSIRNLQLDRLANTFQFPCKFNFNGCQWKSFWFGKREHEKTCEFMTYSCPCPGTSCKWSGLISQVMQHLSEQHKSITTLSGEDIVFLATDINLKGAVDWVMIQSCFNHHFLLVLEKQEVKVGHQQFFAVVQLIGSQAEAANFKYKMELGSNVNGKVKRLQWEATPRSIADGTQTAISTYDCLVFDARMARHFLSPIQKDKGGSSENQGESLAINVTIDRIA